MLVITTYSYSGSFESTMNNYQCIEKLMGYLTIPDQINFCNAAYKDIRLRPCIKLISVNLYRYLCGLKFDTVSQNNIDEFKEDHLFEQFVIKGIILENLCEYKPGIEFNAENIKQLVYYSEFGEWYSSVIYAYGKLKGGDVFYVNGGVARSDEPYEGEVLIAPNWKVLAKHLTESEFYRLLGELIVTDDNSCIYGTKMPERFENNLRLIMCALLFGRVEKLWQVIERKSRTMDCLEHSNHSSYIN